MNDFTKILERVYAEKDTATNLALFIASITSLFFYINKFDMVVTAISFISAFSIAKLLSTVVIELGKKNEGQNYKFSEQELQIINYFIDQGGSFVLHSDYKRGLFEGAGLDSLVTRGCVEFVDNSFGDGPTGFKLDEKVYMYFLDRKSKKS
jgi:hypothetical protein